MEKAYDKITNPAEKARAIATYLQRSINMIPGHGQGDSILVIELQSHRKKLLALAEDLDRKTAS